METEIVELLKEIRDELKKLNAQVQAAQGRDVQKEASEMAQTIMASVMGGMKNGQ